MVKAPIFVAILAFTIALSSYNDNVCYGFTETKLWSRGTTAMFAKTRYQNDHRFENSTMTMLSAQTIVPSTSNANKRRMKSSSSSSSRLYAEKPAWNSDSRGFKATSNSGPLYSSIAVQDEQVAVQGQEESSALDRVLSGYLGPRLVLAAISCFYGTNFPLGAIMADAFPSPSAATAARMVIASIALSPFVTKLDKDLRMPAIMIGGFTAMGYITQSIALVDTSPATVSFLGAATVLVCPFLEWAVDKKPMSIRDAPQTWLAATLCLLGVGILELLNPAVTASGANPFAELGMGDALALLQAVGFGTQIYLSEKLVRDKPDQALPVVSTLIATTAFLSSLWCLADGWMTVDGWQAFTLPQLFFEPSLRTAAGAVVWTGLVSTALNFNVEMAALIRVPPSEATVILATEPMWAALFAALFLGESFGANDYIGGALIVMACLATALKPKDFEALLGSKDMEASKPVRSVYGDDR